MGKYIGVGEQISSQHNACMFKDICCSTRAELEAVRVDAERYRWLRDKVQNQDLVIAKVGSWSLESWSGDDPDAAIDAARGGK